MELNNWGFIKKNKPIIERNATMSLELSIGHLIDIVNQNSSTLNYDNKWQDITVNVSLDNSIIYNGPVTTPVLLDWKFLDSSEYREHNFMIKIDGLDQLDQPGLIVILKNLKIENLSIKKIIGYQKTTYTPYNTQKINILPDLCIEQNGNFKLKFYTPIYRWLFEHRQNII